MSNPLWLNYHDAVLYESDVAILQSPKSWLNDSCIHYQMMRYQHDLYKDDGIRFIFMDPSVISFFMHQCTGDEELLEFYRGQGILGRKLQESGNTNFNEYSIQQALFLPINDTNAVSGVMHGRSSAVGTHWSLLLVVLLIDDENNELQPMYLHFDPVKNSDNYQAAVAVAKKFHHLLSLAAKSDEELNITDIGKMIVRTCKAPQQSNGYDCGIYTLATTNILANTVKNLMEPDGSDHTRGVDPILKSKSTGYGSRTKTMVDQFAHALEDSLQSSKMLTCKKSFASEMRAEMLNSIFAAVEATDAAKLEMLKR